MPSCSKRVLDAGDNDDANDEEKNASIDLNLPRRSMLVSFTCNACGMCISRLYPRRFHVAV